MKFDTKTSKPMPVSPEHCFIRPNKFVPTTTTNDDEETKDDGEGRQVLYQPTIVYTPVYASARIYQDQVSSGRKKLLMERDIDALNQKLEALFVGMNDDDDVTPVVTPPKKADAATPKAPRKAVHFEESKEEEAATELGRCHVKVDNKSVTRSLRVGQGVW